VDRYEDCISLITVVAEALGPHRSEVIFVGGSITGLLITASTLQDVRPTDDVDVVVETTTYSEYNKLLEELRALGFAHDMNGPLCRFTINGIKVDVMPVEESVLGFRNSWYPLVVRTAKQHVLPNGTEIRVVNAPAFVCTKLEAFQDRGKGDFYASADIEDIVAIINGRPELICECWGMPVNAREFLRNSFADFLKDDDFVNALPGLLPHGAANRKEIVRFRMEQLVQLPLVETFSGQVMVDYACDPLSITVISMAGCNQNFASRDFKTEGEFLACLTELGIPGDRSRIRRDAYDQLCSLEGVVLEILVKWNLVCPLD
jgi:hypothetical protein